MSTSLHGTPPDGSRMQTRSMSRLTQQRLSTQATSTVQPNGHTEIKDKTLPAKTCPTSDERTIDAFMYASAEETKSDKKSLSQMSVGRAFDAALLEGGAVAYQATSYRPLTSKETTSQKAL